MTWKIATLKQCKLCHGDIDRSKNKRLRSYCSDACRMKMNQINAQPGRTVWQRERYDRIASEPSPFKKKCAICGRWYKRVGHHVDRRHHMTAKEYRAQFDLPLTKGIMTDSDREHMSKLAYENNMPEQVKRAGKKTRFVKGDPRARVPHPWVGKKIVKSAYY